MSITIQGAQVIEVTLYTMVEVSKAHIIDSWNGDGSMVARTTDYTYKANSLWVLLNGIVQKPGVDYVEADDQTGYTMTTAPKAGWEVEERYVQA